MATTSGLENALSLPRAEGGEFKVARGRIRRWMLIWLGCAALSWAATVVVGYTLIRVGETVGETGVMQAQIDDGETITEADLETIKAVAPAAGGESSQADQ